MGRLPLLGIVLAAALLTIPAASAETQTLPADDIVIGKGNLTIEAGDTLVLQAGTNVTGDGQILVLGSLLVEGTPDAPVNVSVPLVFAGDGQSRIAHARLAGIPGTAVTASSGQLLVEDSVFEANRRAIQAAGESALALRNVTLVGHGWEALSLEGGASVTLSNATVRGNERGATVYSAARFEVERSRFESNGQHLVIDLMPSSAPGVIRLAGNAFLAPAPGPGLPALALRHDPSLASEAPPRTIHLEGNRIEGAAVGLRAEGRGLVVESQRDEIVGNVLGISVQLATVRLVEPTLDNDRDVEGPGQVSIVDARSLRAAPAATATSEPALRWGLGAAAAGALALLGVGLWFLLRRRPASAPVARAPPPPPLEPPSAPFPADGSPALTSAERRVLDDVAAHPGTPQRAIADRLGATRQAIHYHVKKLEARGLLAKTVEGRETRLTLAPAGRALAAPPVTTTRSEEKQ